MSWCRQLQEVSRFLVSYEVHLMICNDNWTVIENVVLIRMILVIPCELINAVLHVHCFLMCFLYVWIDCLLGDVGVSPFFPNKFHTIFILKVNYCIIITCNYFYFSAHWHHTMVSSVLHKTKYVLFLSSFYIIWKYSFLILTFLCFCRDQNLFQSQQVCSVPIYFEFKVKQS